MPELARRARALLGVVQQRHDLVALGSQGRGFALSQPLLEVDHLLEDGLTRLAKASVMGGCALGPPSVR